MGRKRELTASFLWKAIKKYLDGISREVPVMEKVPTGEYDEKGRPIYEEVEAKNGKGETVFRTEFLEPPRMTKFALQSGICYQTMTNAEREPDIHEAVQYLREVCQDWNLRELLTREGKNVRGVEKTLEWCYGMGGKVEVELGEETRNALKPMSIEEKETILKDLAVQFGKSSG